MSDEYNMLDEAVAWHVRLNAGDADEAAFAAFTAWLEASAEHRAAYDRVEDADAAIAPTPDNGARLPEAAKVLKLADFRKPAPAQRRRWIGIAIGGAAAASLAIAVGVWNRPMQPQSVQYATAVGEKKTISLADGSSVTLNTNTRLSTQVISSSRTVTLERGEALFHVARDPAHPFVVFAGDRAVRVVGTVFDVWREAGTVTVVVAQGHVAVSQHAGRDSSPEVHLTPGLRAVGHEGDPAESVEAVNADRVLAWKNGFLIYDNVPLSAVVDDLNRYFTVRIELGDVRVGARRFSGVLRIDDETAVLARLAQFLPVRAEYVRGGIVLRDARKPD